MVKIKWSLSSSSKWAVKAASPGREHLSGLWATRGSE